MSAYDEESGWMPFADDKDKRLTTGINVFVGAFLVATCAGAVDGTASLELHWTCPMPRNGSDVEEYQFELIAPDRVLLKANAKSSYGPVAPCGVAGHACELITTFSLK